MNLAYRAKQIFYLLAEKFGLNEASQNPVLQKPKTTNKAKNNNTTITIDYNLRKDINITTIKELIALRLAINNT